MTTHQMLADRAQEANAIFLAELDDLEAQVKAMMAVPAGEVGQRLRPLREICVEHFRLEEQDGYLSRVLTWRPELDDRRRGLLEDHHGLLQALDAIIRDVDAGEGLTSDLRYRLTHWVRDVRRHEERENEFFDEASNDEPC